MEEENIKKYLYFMNKAIRSGNPKYMPYVSREYMKYRTASPIIAEAISDMLNKEKNRNPKTPFAVFMDSDGSVSLETIGNISQISNLAQFINQVQSLTEYDISFEGMTSDDLILESELIAEELEQEFNSQLQEEQSEEQLEKGTQGVLKKVGILATIGGAVGGVFTAVASRIRTRLAGIRAKKTELSTEHNDEKTNKIKDTPVVDSIPRVAVDERKVIKQMNQRRSEELKNVKNTDTYGDGDPDGDDLGL